MATPDMKIIKTSLAGRAILAALAVVAGAASAATVVFRPGCSEIVVETNACDTIRVAAEEARDFMGRVLGCDVPIVAAPTPSRTALFLGPSRWADAVGVTTNGLKRDGFRIRTAAKGVYVLGIDDPIVNAHRNRQRGGIWFQNFERATVFGVYDFLERFAEVRFYFPGELGTVVPRAAQIVVPPTDLIDAPVNTVRRYTIYETGCPYFEGENATELRHPMKTVKDRTSSSTWTDSPNPTPNTLRCWRMVAATTHPRSPIRGILDSSATPRPYGKRSTRT